MQIRDPVACTGGTKTTQNTCSEAGWALLWRCWGYENHAKYVLRGRLGVAVALLRARKPCKIRAPRKVGGYCGAAGLKKTAQNKFSEEGGGGLDPALKSVSQPW